MEADNLGDEEPAMDKEWDVILCPRCHGTTQIIMGRDAEKSCDSCKGTGRLGKTTTYEPYPKPPEEQKGFLADLAKGLPPRFTKPPATEFRYDAKHPQGVYRVHGKYITDMGIPELLRAIRMLIDGALFKEPANV